MSDIPQWIQDEIQRVKDENLDELILDNNLFAGREWVDFIPPEIFELRHLRVLDLRGIYLLGEIPDELKNLEYLTQLTMSGHYAEIPAWLGDLKNLTQLTLSGRYTEIPDWLGELKNLTQLELSGSYAEIPDWLGELKNLTQLELSGSYAEIPDWLGGLKNLTQLTLFGGYTEIPAWIADLKNLTQLHLGGEAGLGGSYGDIPAWIGDLKSLTQLTLFGGYTEIPAWIADLKNLTQLSLSGEPSVGGRYSEIPDWLGGLKNLTQLHLGGDYTEIPVQIGELKNLTQLTLNGDYTEIPVQIGELKNLTQLTLFGRYSEIPAQIGDLKSLTQLRLKSDIEITSPPPEVIGDGLPADIKALRQYFDDLKNEATSPLYEAKLLIVGEPGAGKTTLAVKIMNENAEMPPEAATTRGIDTDIWNFNLPDDEQFRVNIWDFGGQEIYKATHQFFLTKDSVYALVLDNRTEDDNLIYWLQAVEVLGNKSPLIIIMNQRASNRVRQLNDKELIDRFKNIEAIVDVNLGDTQDGRLKVITNAIESYMQALPHFGTQLPESWIDIRHALEHDERNYVSYEDYFAICANHNLHDRGKATTILGYLHNLGVCLHFADDPVLKHLVILKPEWATTAVYAVLDNEIVIRSHGYFTTNDLLAVWNNPDYEAMMDELLSLMKKFQICYQINETTYIAPQLLKKEEPDYDWDYQDNLILRYEYDFMPKGLLSRFIVASNELIYDKKQWQSGVILHREGAYAEIKENYDRSQITIRTRGYIPERLQYHIMLTIDSLHEPFKQLKVSKKVPCNCSVCQQDREPYFFKYSFVAKLARDKRKATCERSTIDVDAASLIQSMFSERVPPVYEHLSDQWRQDNLKMAVREALAEEKQLTPVQPIPATESAPANDPEKDAMAKELEALKQREQERIEKEKLNQKRLFFAGMSLLWLGGIIATFAIPLLTGWMSLEQIQAQWFWFALGIFVWSSVIGMLVFKEHRSNIFFGIIAALIIGFFLTFAPSASN